jgi:hypothetical protein
MLLAYAVHRISRQALFQAFSVPGKEDMSEEEQEVVEGMKEESDEDYAEASDVSGGIDSEAVMSSAANHLDSLQQK